MSLAFKSWVMDEQEKAEVKELWDDANTSSEAFEAFDEYQIDPDLIEKALGEKILNRYMTWIYLTIK